MKGLNHRVSIALIRLVFARDVGLGLNHLTPKIVDDRSAFIGAATERKIPMPGYDHRDLCRHGSPTDLGLNLILGAIRECLSTESLQSVTGKLNSLFDSGEGKLRKILSSNLCQVHWLIVIFNARSSGNALL